MLEKLLYLIIITIIPWIELRGAIPIGLGVLGLDPFIVFIVSVFANCLIIFPIFLFLDILFPIVTSRIKIFDKLINKVREKTHNYVEKYGVIGLAIFVAIPLPGSGVYSGCLGAYLLGINRDSATKSIILGTIIAGILVSIISLGILNGYAKIN